MSDRITIPLIQKEIRIIVHMRSKEVLSHCQCRLGIYSLMIEPEIPEIGSHCLDAKSDTQLDF